MPVIIIGSGLVGAATALALHKVGIQCSLYDQVVLSQSGAEGKAVEFEESGGSVVIQAGGLRVLRSLGLLEECFANGTVSSYASWYKIDGSNPIVLDFRISNQKAGETDESLLAPLQILRSKHSNASLPSAEIKTFTGKKLVQVTQSETSVTANFADGTSASGELLIGADGIHSATRRQVFGEDLVAKFTGSMGHIGVVRTTETGIVLKDTEECAFYVNRDKKHGVAVFKVSDEWLPFNMQGVCDLLHEWGAPAHVEKMMRNSFRVSSASIYDLPDMETYRKGRVILIGDAAHGMVPNAGIGLLTGLVDVGTLLVLFQQFPGQEDRNKVLDMYSTIRVARATEASRQARDMRSKSVATSVFGGGFNHFLLRIAITAVNAGLYTLYNVIDCEADVMKLIEESKTHQ
ncbi:FAD/NAD(P)-binding domain-containing protein [Rhizoclosmatium globosum]|uniref:FAD/NAD(P)-binding domain-containing protein n=1 Tax=Rhizoclosmatium globosum TaxID=329046 RepID=A0A1Y2BV71_9FUNG|nr:FAD/NAD(P)-binding domain-containing protein [Rhizoclosmatium globosum]|eukprot:ORY38660.1 FAD/NAD(P)-binding domain-containing protein [Rhizoclosmatium globosum]